MVAQIFKCILKEGKKEICSHIIFMGIGLWRLLCCSVSDKCWPDCVVGTVTVRVDHSSLSQTQDQNKTETDNSSSQRGPFYRSVITVSSPRHKYVSVLEQAL